MESGVVPKTLQADHGTAAHCANAAALCRAAAKTLPPDASNGLLACADACERCSVQLVFGGRDLLTGCARACEAAAETCALFPALREVVRACHLCAAACYETAGCLDC